MKWNTLVLTVIAAGVVYLLLKDVGVIPGKPPQRDTVSKVIVVDTSRGQVTINNWQPRITVDVPEQERIKDTVWVYMDYYRERTYDTTGGDTSFTWKAKMLVRENKLQMFGLQWQGLARTTTITLKDPPRNQVHLGAYLGGREAFDYGVQGLYTQKNRVAYNAAYSLPRGEFRMGVFWPIK